MLCYANPLLCFSCRSIAGAFPSIALPERYCTNLCQRTSHQHSASSVQIVTVPLLDATIRYSAIPSRYQQHTAAPTRFHSKHCPSITVLCQCSTCLSITFPPPFRASRNISVTSRNVWSHYVAITARYFTLPLRYYSSPCHYFAVSGFARRYNAITPLFEAIPLRNIDSPRLDAHNHCFTVFSLTNTELRAAPPYDATTIRFTSALYHGVTLRFSALLCHCLALRCQTPP